jgi:hypothetical protein
MTLAVIVLSLWATFMQAATPADSAVLLAFKQADSGLAHFAVLHRTGVTQDLDLVIAIGSPRSLWNLPIQGAGWSEDERIGLFFQEKVRPERVYPLGTKSGFQDCMAYIERVTATDTVVSCQGEKSTRDASQKWVYDARAKKLLAQFSYQPFAMYRIFPNAGGAVFVGSDTQRLVAVEYKPDREPAFRVLSDAEAQPWLDRVKTHVGTMGTDAHRIITIEDDKAPPSVAIPPLPRTTYDQFAAARPRHVQDGYTREQTNEIQDSVGPWQDEGGRTWFGKTFYDGEANTGVGGFGYLDWNDGKLHLFTVPEIADWSVSAIAVASDAVWMALVANGEWGPSSGGLLRYDRQTVALRRFEFPDVAVQLIRSAGRILAATDFGLAIIEGDRVKRYFIDRTTDGRLQVAPATR